MGRVITPLMFIPSLAVHAGGWELYWSIAGSSSVLSAAAGVLFPLEQLWPRPLAPGRGASGRRAPAFLPPVAAHAVHVDSQ